MGIRAGTFNILSERIARNVRKDFYDSIVDKDIAFYDVNRTGELGKFYLTFNIFVTREFGEIESKYPLQKADQFFIFE